MGLYFNLSWATAVAASQPEYDPVLTVHRHAVHQPSPQALVELGDDLRQVLHALDEPLDLPAANHDLVDLLHDGIALALGFSYRLTSAS